MARVYIRTKDNELARNIAAEIQSQYTDVAIHSEEEPMSIPIKHPRYITRKGGSLQLTIPHKIARQFHLEEGDMMEFVYNEKIGLLYLVKIATLELQSGSLIPANKLKQK